MNIQTQDFFDTEARRAHGQYKTLLDAVETHKKAGTTAAESKRRAKRGKEAIKWADEARGCEFDRLLAIREATAFGLDVLLPAMSAALSSALALAAEEVDAAKDEAQAKFAELGVRPGLGASTPRQQSAFAAMRHLKERRAAHNDIRHAIVERFEAAGNDLAALLERL